MNFNNPLVISALLIILVIITTSLIWIAVLLNQQTASDNPVRYHSIYIDKYRDLVADLNRLQPQFDENGDLTEPTGQIDRCQLASSNLTRQTQLFKTARDKHGVDVRNIPDLIPDIQRVNEIYYSENLVEECQLDLQAGPLRNNSGGDYYPFDPRY